MKIAIPIIGKSLDSNIDQRFGRCKGFIFVESDTLKGEYHDNPGFSQAGGAGIATAQFLANGNIKVIICGELGPNAFDSLNAAEIKIFQVKETMTAKEAVERLNNGQLKEVESPTGPSHAGMGGGQGRGMGRGRNR